MTIHEFSSSEVMITQQALACNLVTRTPEVIDWSAGVQACDAEDEGKLVIYTLTTLLNDIACKISTTACDSPHAPNEYVLLKIMKPLNKCLCSKISDKIHAVPAPFLTVLGIHRYSWDGSVRNNSV